MISVLFVLSGVAGFVTQVAAMRISGRHPLFGVLWYGTWAVICVALAALDLAAGASWWAPVMAVCAVLNAWMCWMCWNRRRRRRAPRAFGAKSRARIAALVRKARQAAKPRRVLRPSPSPAS